MDRSGWLASWVSLCYCHMSYVLCVADTAQGKVVGWLIVSIVSEGRRSLKSFALGTQLHVYFPRVNAHLV